MYNFEGLQRLLGAFNGASMVAEETVRLKGSLR